MKVINTGYQHLLIVEPNELAYQMIMDATIGFKDGCFNYAYLLVEGIKFLIVEQSIKDAIESNKRISLKRIS